MASVTLCAQEVTSAIERSLSCDDLESISSDVFSLSLLSVACCVLWSVEVSVVAWDATCPRFAPFFNESWDVGASVSSIDGFGFSDVARCGFSDDLVSSL